MEIKIHKVFKDQFERAMLNGIIVLYEMPGYGIIRLNDGRIFESVKCAAGNKPVVWLLPMHLES